MKRPAIFHGAHRPPRRHVVIAGMTALTLGAAGPAWAYWTATASTATSATAQTLAAPVTVTVGSATTSSLTVTVTGGPATGPVPSGYRVQRNGITVTGCSAVALNTGCTEPGLTGATQYTYTVASVLGTNWVSATSTSASGATVPATPAAPALLAADDTGSNAADGLTKITNPRFTGSAPAGSTVSLFDGSATTAFATVSPVPAGGTWQSAATALSTGTHSITAKVTANALTSAASPAASITIDTTVPTMGAASVACTGTTSNGFCRGTTTVTVPSLADSGSGIDSVSYSVSGGGPSGTAALNGSTATIVFSSPDGTPTATYTATDKAGNQSAPGTKQVATAIDNTAPAATGVQLGGNNGSAGNGDTVTLTYGDGTGSGLDSSSLCSTWSGTGSQSIAGNGVVTVTITNNGSSDLLGVSVTSASCGGTFNLGTVNLNADYVGATTTFSGNGGNKSTITWNGTTQLVITLGSASGGTNSGVAAAVPSYTGSASIKDLAGNPLSTSAVNGTSSRF